MADVGGGHPGGVIVLDDDPTGTQAAAGVPVLLDLDEAALRAWFERHEPGPVFVLTNTRALDAGAAEVLVRRVSAVARQSWPDCRFVLRGDSTLRGHVGPEYRGVLADRPLPLLLVPAMPEGGRLTVGGSHVLLRDGELVPLSATEYAGDPDFGYVSSDLLSWAEERSGGLLPAARGARVALDQLRSSEGAAVAAALAAIVPPAVCCVDATTEHDLELAHAGLEAALAGGLEVIVRAAPPFAALAAGRRARSLVTLRRPGARLLVVAGSYVPLTTRQLAALERRRPGTTVEADPDRLLVDPGREQARLAGEVASRWSTSGICVVATPRTPPARSLVTSGHGQRVAEGLAGLLDHLAEPPDLIIGKGGVTAAVVARSGLHANSAWVEGPPRAGLSLWEVGTDSPDSQDATGVAPRDARSELVVFAGNVGGDDTLADLVDGIVAA
jgi:uncharacterized protein YgbK (DUF1537 family)